MSNPEQSEAAKFVEALLGAVEQDRNERLVAGVIYGATKATREAFPTKRAEQMWDSTLQTLFDRMLILTQRKSPIMCVLLATFLGQMLASYDGDDAENDRKTMASAVACMAMDYAAHHDEKEARKAEKSSG